MLAKLMLPVVGTVALAGAYVVHEGAVRVTVDEQAPGGHHIHLWVPAAAIPLGMKVVPEEKLRQASAQVRPWLPAICVASEELDRLPDSELIEVRDAREHVRIAKRGRTLMIDVESPAETVRISFPLKTANRVARHLESLRPAS